jgi:hypothetical protein
MPYKLSLVLKYMGDFYLSLLCIDISPGDLHVYLEQLVREVGIVDFTLYLIHYTVLD